MVYNILVHVTYQPYDNIILRRQFVLQIIISRVYYSLLLTFATALKEFDELKRKYAEECENVSLCTNSIGIMLYLALLFLSMLLTSIVIFIFLFSFSASFNSVGIRCS